MFNKRESFSYGEVIYDGRNPTVFRRSDSDWQSTGERFQIVERIVLPAI